MDNKDIIKELLDISPTGRLNYARRRKEIWGTISSYTDFLEGSYSDVSDKQRLYHFMEDSRHIVNCPVCDSNPAIFGTLEIRENRKYKGKVPGYRPCSTECRNKLHSKNTKKQISDPNFQINRDKKLIEKYGTTNTSSGIFMKRRIQTIQNKHSKFENYIDTNTEELISLLKNKESELDYNIFLPVYGDVIKYITSFLDDHYKNIKYSQRLWHIRNNIFEAKKCVVCNDNFAKYHQNSNSYKSCSKECKNKIISRKAKELYPESIKKARLTWLDLYGTDNPLEHPDVLNKISNTVSKRYGVSNIMHNKKLLEEIKSKNLSNFVDKILPKEYEFIDRDKSEITLKHIKCDHIFIIPMGSFYCRFYTGKIVCTNCNKPYESENVDVIYDHIASIYDGEIHKEYSIIRGNKLDLYIPDKSIALEYNGLIFHSDHEKLGKKSKDYHRNRLLLHKTAGVRIMNIWEDDWLYRQPIVISIINGMFNKNRRIFARKCEIKKMIGNIESKFFLNKNHLQGYVPYDIGFGLYYENQLVQVMTFKKLDDNGWEIGRLCTDINTSVIGGASRLFSKFIKEHDPEKITTFCDASMFTGKTYEEIGMTQIEMTIPNRWYIKGGKNPERLNWRASNNIIYSNRDKFPDKNGEEIMKEMGYNKVWGCGNYKYLWIKPL